MISFYSSLVNIEFTQLCKIINAFGISLETIAGLMNYTLFNIFFIIDPIHKYNGLILESNKLN